MPLERCDANDRANRAHTCRALLRRRTRCSSSRLSRQLRIELLEAGREASTVQLELRIIFLAQCNFPRRFVEQRPLFLSAAQEERVGGCRSKQMRLCGHTAIGKCRIGELSARFRIITVEEELCR